eukprot:Rmarinus@m.8221
MSSSTTLAFESGTQDEIVTVPSNTGTVVLSTTIQHLAVSYAKLDIIASGVEMGQIFSFWENTMGDIIVLEFWTDVSVSGPSSVILNTASSSSNSNPTQIHTLDLSSPGLDPANSMNAKFLLTEFLTFEATEEFETLTFSFYFTYIPR